jgi:hypothetical protein
MADDRVRLSQVVGLYGPGAMLDLPERSVVVMGLDDWEMSGPGTFRSIQEPRLQRLLQKRLSGDARLAGDRAPELRTPPIDPNDPARVPKGIKAKIFPNWFVCDTATGDPPNRRRMVQFNHLTPPKFQEHTGDDGKKRRASPIRFVCGCENGHLGDIEWRRILHSSGASCREQMWLEDSGTSGHPHDTKVVCDCGASLSLDELYARERLGQCKGERPWIGDRDPNACTKLLRLLTRSATNTYFPQVARVISLPRSVDELSRRIEQFWAELHEIATVDELRAARRFNPQIRANLDGFSDEAVLGRIKSMASSSTAADPAENPILAEYEVLASGDPVIGENAPDARLHAETLDRSIWDAGNAPLLAPVRSLVAVHRLCEVSCLYGFTRFEPAPTASDELEDVGLAVEGAPLGRAPTWLPAVEAFGEGIFVLLDPAAIEAWMARADAQQRLFQLRAGAAAWEKARKARNLGAATATDAQRQRPEYILTHSLAHALMTEIALDCGYPASSLRERIYVLPREMNTPSRCGLLIYTASTGNQGTLGGLVEVTRRFGAILAAALEHQRLCSGDPVCADHDPATADEDRMLHGAACHGCLLISETSCEARNVYLDRSLLVPTVGRTNAAFFALDDYGVLP